MQVQVPVSNDTEAPPPPCTPPRCDDRDGQEEADDGIEEQYAAEGPDSRKVQRGRRQWEVLATFDRTAVLDSEVTAAIQRIADEKMEESGLVEWPSARIPSKTIGLWILGHSYTREGGMVDIETYYCPLKDRCGCPVQLRVTRTVVNVVLEISGGEHTQARCHPTDTKSKHLNYKQRIAVAKIVKANPAVTSRDVRMSLQNLSPSGKVPSGLAKSVRSVVKIQKKKSLGVMAGGVEVDNSFASHAALGERLWFGDIMRKHNSGEQHFSDPHQVICIGNVSPEAAGEELFLNVSTIWSVLNISRGLASGWPNILCGDGTGKLSRHEATMLSFGITSIPAQFNTLNYCLGPVENCDLYTQSWDGVKTTWNALMKNWLCCDISYAHCLVCALISHFRADEEVKAALTSGTIIHKAKSDNTDLFRNFAQSIDAIPLTCDVHGSGIYHYPFRAACFLLGSGWY